MTLTLSTAPLALLSLFLLYRSRWSFIAVAMFMSVFQAASAVNIGSSIGIGICYPLLLVGVLQAYSSSPRTLRVLSLKKVNSLLIGFVAYAALSAFICPFLFQGALYTNPKMGFDVPLRWETGHLNQLFYLFLAFGLFLVASTRLSKEKIQESLDWYVAGNCLASAVALYQYASLKTGIPFPSEFLHTNPVYGIFEAYEIGGFARINSTFVEASAAAGFLVPALAVVLWRLLTQPNWEDGAKAILIFIGLFLTISTTGYVSFAFLILISTAVFVFKWAPRSGARATKLAFGSLVLLILIGFTAIPQARRSVADLLDIVIFSKTNTFSYEQRTQMNNDAWQTAKETYWLGAGFGVCRGSSLIPTLFGSVGMPGMLLLVGFIALLLKPAWRTSRSAMLFFGQPLFAVSVSVFGLIVAGPEITSPQLWLFFAACARGASQGFRHRVERTGEPIPLNHSSLFPVA